MGHSMHKKFSFAAAATAIATLTLASTAAFAGPNAQPAPSGGGKGVHTAGATNVSGWAVVAADGTFARGSNVAGVLKLGSGTYEVQMNSKLKHCAFVASAGDPAASSSGFGVVTTANRSGNEKAVFVQAFNQAGASTDTDFHLIVDCS